MAARRAGAAGLANQSPGPRRFWNRIPDAVREQVVAHRHVVQHQIGLGSERPARFLLAIDRDRLDERVPDVGRRVIGLVLHRQGAGSASIAEPAVNPLALLFRRGGLEMIFSGTRLDVVYIQGPELGTFAVEVDGAVLLTVNSGVGASYTSAWAMLPDLAPGTQTLRILPVEGAVAFDGLDVEQP